MLLKQFGLSLENAVDHENKRTDSDRHNEQNEEDRAQEHSLSVRHVHVEQGLLVVLLVICTVVNALMDRESRVVRVSFGLKCLSRFVAMCCIDIVFGDFKSVPLALLLFSLLSLQSVIAVCILTHS